MSVRAGIGVLWVCQVSSDDHQMSVVGMGIPGPVSGMGIVGLPGPMSRGRMDIPGPRSRREGYPTIMIHTPTVDGMTERRL